MVVLDWQSIGLGPAAYDVAYLLGGSLSVEDRREHEEWLIGYYLERLQSAGVAYSFDELWTDYRLAHLANVSVAVVTGGTMDLANDRGRDLISTLAERHFTAVLDLQSLDLLP